MTPVEREKLYQRMRDVEMANAVVGERLEHTSEMIKGMRDELKEHMQTEGDWQGQMSATMECLHQDILMTPKLSKEQVEYVSAKTKSAEKSDAFWDKVLGKFSEAAATTMGKHFPYLLLGLIILAITFGEQVIKQIKDWVATGFPLGG